MNFLNPFFLFGLLAVAIPVIIHLVNLRRPQKVSFSTLAFLTELKKSTIKRIRIKQYLLMALRAMALLLLALALARPFLPPTLSSSASSDAPQAIALLIDNSASMNRIGPKGPLIEQAKDIALTIINSSRSEDRFIVSTTNGAQAATSLTGGARALELVTDIEASNTGNYISPSLSLIYNQLQQSPQKQGIVYLISDGQKSQLDDLQSFGLNNSEVAQSIALQMISLGNINQQNLTIADIQLKSQILSKGSPIELAVTVKNVGDAAATNQFVSLEVNGRMAGQYQMALDPGQSQDFLFELNADKVGDITGKIILDGDEIVFDNTRYFVLRIPDSRSVLLVNEEPNSNSEFVSYLKPALEAAQKTNTQIAFTEQEIAQTDQSNWRDYDLLIFDGLKEIPEYWFTDLQRFVQEGKGLIFFPSEQGDITNYNKFLDLFNAGSFTNINGEYASFKAVASLGPLVEGHPILDELFDKKENDEIRLQLPDLFYYYTYSGSGNTGSHQILKSQGGLPILAEQRFGEGKILISSIGTDPGWSNFPVTPLFAPLYYRSMLYASSSEQGGIEEHLLGNNFEWEGDITAQNIELTLGNNTMKPELKTLPDGVKISYPGTDWAPGILEISGGDEKRRIAVNQDIRESDFSTLSNQEFKEMLADYLTVNDIIEAAGVSEEALRTRLNTASFGKEIWNWLIWLAVIFLIVETMVARLYKAETIS